MKVQLEFSELSTFNEQAETSHYQVADGSDCTKQKAKFEHLTSYLEIPPSYLQIFSPANWQLTKIQFVCSKLAVPNNR